MLNFLSQNTFNIVGGSEKVSLESPMFRALDFIYPLISNQVEISKIGS